MRLEDELYKYIIKYIYKERRVFLAKLKLKVLISKYSLLLVSHLIFQERL